jgi:hypothetical protein
MKQYVIFARGVVTVTAGWRWWVVQFKQSSLIAVMFFFVEKVKSSGSICMQKGLCKRL